MNSRHDSDAAGPRSDAVVPHILSRSHVNVALAMDQMGKPHEARGAFKKAVELAPDDPRMKEASILKQSISK